MNAPPAFPYDLIAADLRGLADQEGAALWQNRHRLTGLMLDHQPDLRREIKTMASAVELGVAQALADGDRSLAGIAIDRQAALMESEIGLRAEVAQNVVRAIAHALNLGPLPSVYVQDPGPRSDPRGSDRRPAMPLQPVAAPPPQPAWSSPYSSQPVPPPHHSQPVARGPNLGLIAAILGGVLVLVLGILFVPRMLSGPAAAPATAIAAPTRPPANPSLGYGHELVDYRVPAQSTLQSNVGSPTPLDIPAGRRVTTEQVRELIGSGNPILIDVLDGAHGRTLTGAHWLPAVGRAGVFTDEHQVNGKNAIDRLAGGDTSRALIFYCMGVNCWESYNATLRAAAMGYSNLYWYRGGLQAWEDAGLPMQALGAQLGGN